MKNIVLLFTGCALLFGATSCEDFLEEKAYTSVTDTYLTSSPDGLAAAVVGLYELQRSLYYEDQTMAYGAKLLGADETWMRAGSGRLPFSQYEDLNSEESQLYTIWSNEYSVIAAANVVITAAEDGSVDAEDETVIQAVAEARMFRAQAYFNLIRRWDNILLTTTVTTPETLNEEKWYEPAPQADVYDLIIRDIEAAIPTLAWTVTETGRYTKGAAYHIRAKVAACQEDWAGVIANVDSLEAGGVYSLVDVENVFNSGNLDHSEVILASQWSRSTGGWKASSDGGEGNGHRLQRIFTPRYYYESCMVIAFEQGGYPYGWILPNNYHLGLFDENDLRFQHWYRRYWTLNSEDTDSYNRGTYYGDTIFAATAAQYQNVHPTINKFEDSYTLTDVNESYSYKDIIIYRLSETYLMAAEAYLELGNEAKALYYYNLVWERAGNAAKTAIVMEDIIEEHSRELCLEGDRWHFLKRRGILVERVRANGGDYLLSDGVELANDTVCRTNIKDCNSTWPIPYDQMQLMINPDGSSYPQNEGYY